MTGDNVSVWILGDQLLARHPALVAALETRPSDRVRIVLVESLERTRRLPYQRKKLVLLFSAMRHYAAELAEQGYHVEIVRADSFAEGLRQHVTRYRPARLLTMAASGYTERMWQQDRLAEAVGVPVKLLPNTQFLVGQADPFPGMAADRRVVMERFYRTMRRQTGALMTGDGQPVGGRWNLDAENRKPLPRGKHIPAPLSFAPDAITRQVMAEVQAEGHGLGSTEGFALAVTRREALAALADFVQHRLADFGPYEDAMSSEQATLYHSLLSPYLNIGLLEPLEVIRAAEHAYEAGQAPLNSAEGFVRQVLGWREYIYWQYWRTMPGLLQANAWKAVRPLPRCFWDGDTEMNCLRHAIVRAIATGYNHHIERLMLLCNFCLLAGIDPSAVLEWFNICYVDAYDWVMAPNVLGMGLNADGGFVATKPYIASAAYIRRMSDYCRACRYDHRRRHGEGACPFNLLYWNFLLQHENTLRAQPRLGRNVLGLRHLEDEERAAVRRQASAWLEGLDRHAI